MQIFRREEMPSLIPLYPTCTFRVTFGREEDDGKSFKDKVEYLSCDCIEENNPLPRSWLVKVDCISVLEHGRVIVQI